MWFQKISIPLHVPQSEFHIGPLDFPFFKDGIPPSTLQKLLKYYM